MQMYKDFLMWKMKNRNLIIFNKPMGLLKYGSGFGVFDVCV